MNQNNFDDQQSQTPRDGGEHFNIYNSEKFQPKETVRTVKKKSGGKRTAAAVISAVLLIVLFMTAVLVSSFAVASYYNGLLDDVYTHQQVGPDNRNPSAETNANGATGSKPEKRPLPFLLLRIPRSSCQSHRP